MCLQQRIALREVILQPVTAALEHKTDVQDWRSVKGCKLLRMHDADCTADRLPSHRC